MVKQAACLFKQPAVSGGMVAVVFEPFGQDAAFFSEYDGKEIKDAATEDDGGSGWDFDVVGNEQSGQTAKEGNEDGQQNERPHISCP